MKKVNNNNSSTAEKTKKELKLTKVIVKSFSDDITVPRDYYCESCAGYITSGRLGNIKYDIENNVFCKHCGQKLDWRTNK